MNILLAKHYGLCFGVKRAIKLAKINARGNFGKKLFTLGPIIHNPQTVEFLKNKNNVIPLEEYDDIKKYKKEDILLVIRSHGIPKNFEEKLFNEGYKLIDATCPFVKKAQNIANDLKNRQIFTIIVGDRNHPEVIGIKSYASKYVVIVNSINELKDVYENDIFNIGREKIVGVLSQTTQSVTKLEEIVNFLKNKNIIVEKYNTICLSTLERQTEAYKIANVVNIVFVIGGKNSSNTNKLFEICRKVNNNVFYLEDDKDIDELFISNKLKISNLLSSTIGLVTGASTSCLIIRKIINKFREIDNDRKNCI